MPPRYWRYSVGTKGVNRVTVYERATGATIYVEWLDDLGRHQRALKTMLGHPVTDRELAKKIAKHMSEAQEQKRNRQAAEVVFGFSPDRTLGELLERLHEDRGQDWSETYTKDQKRFRAFWLAKLGAGLRVAHMPPAMVEKVVREAGDREGWSSRTRQAYLRYIVDASYYAQQKLKWIGEAQNLSAVTIPAPKSQSKAYSRTEIPRLLDALHEVDLRAAFVGEVAWVSGRRLNAIRSLTTDALLVRDHAGERVGILSFPGATDKARNAGEAVLTGRALEAAEQLRAKPAVKASGLFCVEGDLQDRTKRAELTDPKVLIGWLHEAERRAGIPTVQGRAYHGIKRRFATEAGDRRAASKQSGTTEDTLGRHYEQDDLAPKVALAKNLDAKRVAR